METVKVKEEVKAEYEYRAFDGTVFEDVDECLEYERKKKKEIHSDIFSFVHIPDFGEIIVTKIADKSDFVQKLLVLNEIYPSLCFAGSDTNNNRYRWYCSNRYKPEYDGRYIYFYYDDVNCYYAAISCNLVSEIYEEIEVEIAERNKTLTELNDIISK